MNEGVDEVRWGRTRIAYQYRFSDRKTLAITVRPDLSVTVTAPQATSRAAIRAKVLRRAGWICNARREFELYLPKQPPRRYVSGESHRYLGRQYRLRVRPGPDEAVKLERGFLLVTSRSPRDPDVVRRLVRAWYRRRAEEVFAERMEHCSALVIAKNAAPVHYRLQQLTKRWGSCTASGEILLNVDLVKAPKESIDYVIVHELCHLKERRHGNKFAALMDKALPDWRTRREKLNRLVDT